MANTVQHKLNVDKDTLKKVTVYNDRAELKRQFIVNVKQGPNEVILMNIARTVYADSVRVNGTGDAVIEEVKVYDLIVDAEEPPITKDTKKEKELNARKEELTRKLKALALEKDNIAKKGQVVDELLSKVGKRDIGGSKVTRFTSDEEELKSISAFFAFYDCTIAKLREEKDEKEKESNAIQQEFTEIESQLGQISVTVNTPSKPGRVLKTISVFLDCTIEGIVTLDLVYQVPNVSWTPLYDLRVATKEGKTELQVSYFANVTQRLGEDWKGGQLILSTARPSQGATIPELPTVDVSFYRPPPPTHPAPPQIGPCAREVVPAIMPVPSQHVLRSPVVRPKVMRLREAIVEESTVSTQFVISRPVSIPSDGVQHKVTIGVVTLSAHFVHEAVPSKNCSAFLTASCVNTSSLPFLPGQASIFLDGAFVAKTSLQAVSPGERFRCSLGVDPSVKIDYKPVHTFHEQTRYMGYINKSSATIHEKKIVVKNTRADAIILTVREAIPRSTDEKIQVKLISPEQVEFVDEEALEELEENTAVPGAKIMSNNNLEWTIGLDKGASQTLVVQYSVEHPPTERIEFKERRN